MLLKLGGRLWTGEHVQTNPCLAAQVAPSLPGRSHNGPPVAHLRAAARTAVSGLRRTGSVHADPTFLRRFSWSGASQECSALNFGTKRYCRRNMQRSAAQRSEVAGARKLAVLNERSSLAYAADHGNGLSLAANTSARDHDRGQH